MRKRGILLLLVSVLFFLPSLMGQADDELSDNRLELKTNRFESDQPSDGNGQGSPLTESLFSKTDQKAIKASQKKEQIQFKSKQEQLFQTKKKKRASQKAVADLFTKGSSSSQGETASLLPSSSSSPTIKVSSLWYILPIILIMGLASMMTYMVAKGERKSGR